MITIKLLEDAGFFLKIQEMKKAASLVGIQEIYIAPAAEADLDEDELVIILDTKDCKVGDRLDFQNQLRDFYSHSFQIQFFSVDAIQEGIAARDPEAHRLESLQENAIPLEELNLYESLEIQWERQQKIANSLLIKKFEFVRNKAERTEKQKEEAAFEELPHNEVVQQGSSKRILVAFQGGDKLLNKKQKAADESALVTSIGENHFALFVRKEGVQMV